MWMNNAFKIGLEERLAGGMFPKCRGFENVNYNNQFLQGTPP